MNTDKYKTKLPYPTRLTKPFCKTTATVKEAEQYIADLKVYETERAEYDAKLKAYQEDNARLLAQFKTDLFDELGIKSNSRCETLYEIAWESGHANGLYEVYIHAEKLLPLIC